MKISDTQRNFIQLLLRSSDIGDGWRKVSNMLRPITEETVQIHPELYETKEEEDGSFMIRLSERGAILGEYL